MRPIAGLIGLSLFARLLVLLLIEPNFGGDAVDYIAIATGHEPATPRSIGYPIFITGPYALGGAWLVIAVQTIFSSGTAVATYLLLRDRPHAFLAAALFATSPFLAFYDTAILSESLYVSLVWLAWLLLKRNPLLAATLLGAAVLTRETLALLPFCALPFVARRYWPLFAATSLLAVPAIAQSTTGGLNLWVGTWERDSSWYDRSGINDPQFPADAFKSDGERAAVLRSWPHLPASLAIDRVAEYPVETATAWLERYPRLWLGTRSEGFQFRMERGAVPWTILKVGLYGLNLLMLALGLWGLWGNLRYLTPVAYAAVIYIPFHAEARYTLMAMPFLCLGVARLAVAVRRRRA